MLSRTLAADLAMALDPVLLARAAGIEPDPWQRNVLRSPSSRLLLNCSRQSGKSTTTAILAIHTALYEPGSLILLLSPSMRQSQELFRKCLDLYRALDRIRADYRGGGSGTRAFRSCCATSGWAEMEW